MSSRENVPGDRNGIGLLLYLERECIVVTATQNASSTNNANTKKAANTQNTTSQKTATTAKTETSNNASSTMAKKKNTSVKTTDKSGKNSKSKTASKIDKMLNDNANLKTAVQQIEKQFGDGSIMPLGVDSKAKIQGISSGCLSLDMALGGRGVTRGRIIEIFGPE